MSLSSAREYPAPDIRSLPEIVYAWLRERILNGSLAPGSELRQEQLARQFAVSRVPVREAMSRLQAEGLIVLRPRRGFAVTSLELSEIVEIFELRMVLEEHALTVATRARRTADIAEVEAILARMEALDRSGADYLLEWGSLNRQFHARLIAAAGRQRLSEVALGLRDAVEPYIRLESHFTGDFGEAETEHRAIFEAFRAGDPEQAGRLSGAHCASTLRRLVPTVDRGS